LKTKAAWRATGCPSLISKPPRVALDGHGVAVMFKRGQAVSSGGSRLEPARFGSYGKPLGGGVLPYLPAEDRASFSDRKM
jgi:hypothetical protein